MNRDFILITLGRVFQVVISLISVRAFTSFLTTAEVGNLYLVNAIVSFFGLALINPVVMYMYRRLNRWQEEKSLLNCFFVFNWYILSLAFLSLPIIYFLNKVLGLAVTIDIYELMVFIFCYIYFLTWNQTINPSLNLLHKRAGFVLFTVLTLFCGVTISILLVRYLAASAIVWLTGQLVAQGLIAIIAFIYFKKTFNATLDIKRAREMINSNSLAMIVRFAFPLSLTTFFMWVQYQSYRMVIDKTLGLEFLGMIGLGFAISSTIASVVESIVQQLYYPGLYQEINTEDPAVRTESWNRLAQTVLPVYMTLTIMVSCLAPFLVNILASDKFGQAFLLVAYGAWIELFRMVTNLLASIAHVEMQTKYLLKAYFIGGVFALVGTYLATWGVHGQTLIPAVLAVSGFVTMGVMYLDMKKLMRFKIGIRRVWKAALLSVPFLLAIPFYGQSQQLFTSLVVALLGGGYFLLTQYRFFQGAEQGVGQTGSS